LRTFDVTQITEEVMSGELAKAKDYSLVILRTTPKTFTPEGRPIIWEHGRRNFALRADGVLSIVCPVTDGGDVAGIGIFDASVDEVGEIIEGDPAVQAGVLEYEIHPVRGFPGDRLPA
jgi:hypothetical protein